MSLAERIVKRPVLGIVVFGLIAIVALYVVPGIAIDMFPEMNLPMLVITTTYSGAGPETVEKSVTRLLESQLVNVSGLKDITSTSSENSSMVMMEFDYGTNLDERVNDIRDRLDRVKSRLPDDASAPVILQMDPNSQPILRIAVRGNRTQNDLRSIAVNTVQDRLEQIDGVASTSVQGGREEYVKVELSLNRLEAYGLSITQIAGTLAVQNLELGAGSIVDGSTNYSIRTSGEFRSVSDIASTVVARRGGADIRLIDVGTVTQTYPDETQTVYINGETGVYVSVTKQSGTNTVAVANAVYAKLDGIRAYLPAGVFLEVTQDSSSQIRDMITELVNSAVLGAALAMGILFIFLRSIKSTVIIGISIPFSILVTLLVMHLAGLTLNMLTMAGLILGVGMIVDCSIVILENIFSYRQRGENPSASAILGSQEVMSSIISSTLTTLCVFVPIILFKNRLGMTGELVQGLVLTVGIALASSLLVAIFLVPILAGKYLTLNTRSQKPLKNKVLVKIDGAAGGAIQKVTDGYRKLLSAALRHRLATSLIVAAAFLGSVIAIPKMRISMMPPMNEDSVTVNVTMPQGTIYEDTKAVMLQLQDIVLEEINGTKNVIVTAGSGGGGMGMGGSRSSSNTGSINITFDMNAPGADTSQTAMAKLRGHFNDFPNAEISFGMGMARMLSGGSDIDLALRVDDIDRGLAAAREMAEIVRQNVPELTDIAIDMTEGLPEVEIVIDRSRAYNMGLSVSSIAREISAAMNGVTATTFRANGSEYSVTLVLRDEDREKLPDLERIFVASGTGALVPLSNFASLERGMGPVSINRENQARTIHITGSLASQAFDARTVEEKVRAALDSNFILPEEMTLLYEGAWQNISDTLGTFIVIITLAILLVFGVMAGQYESFRDPFVNLATIPLMLIGVVYIHLIAGEALSMLSMVGLVMLAGIVVNNGIVLVDCIKLLRTRGMALEEACLEAGVSRLRPVLMTTLTTILGLIPMAFFPGDSATMIQGIGFTVIGGLVSSTIITLFFIPVLYLIINGGGKKKRAETLLSREPVLLGAAQ